MEELSSNIYQFILILWNIIKIVARFCSASERQMVLVQMHEVMISINLSLNTSNVFLSSAELLGQVYRSPWRHFPPIIFWSVPGSVLAFRGNVTPYTTTTGTNSAPQPRLGSHHRQPLYSFISTDWLLCSESSHPRQERVWRRQSLHWRGRDWSLCVQRTWTLR